MQSPSETNSFIGGIMERKVCLRQRIMLVRCGNSHLNEARDAIDARAVQQHRSS